jgi:hypothetical protein
LQTKNPRRWLRTVIGAAATLALTASALIAAAPSAHAATVNKTGVVTAAAPGSVTTYQDFAVTTSFVGCHTYGYLEENVGGTWTEVGYLSLGTNDDPCTRESTSGQFSMYTALWYDGSNKYKTLTPGTHVYRMNMKSQSEDHGTDDWDISAAISNEFTVKVTKAKTTFVGWGTGKTITIKPGGKFTLPKLTINNVGYEKNYILEVNYGGNWVCYSSYRCASTASASSIAITHSPVSMGSKYNGQMQFRYKIRANAYASGGFSPIITVKANKGVGSAKATKISFTASGTQQYNKKQASLKATVTPKAAAGYVFADVYKKTANGYQLAYSQSFSSAKLKKGKATDKLSKTAVKKGTYYVMMYFQPTNVKKYRASFSKLKKWVVK